MKGDGAPYPIVLVPTDVRRHDEVLGTKYKFWYAAGASRPEWLFKRPRANEDWSEKVAAQLAELLDLPHAHYDLALYGGQPGVVSRSFIGPEESMIHGNEVLAERDPTYPLHETFRARRHTVPRVLEALQPFEAAGPLDGLGAAGVFVGYLLLDAWIGNTDRHHENWALLHGPDGARLAPTFDHATCLGRELLLNEVKDRLTTRDRRRTVEAYARRARSAFYDEGARDDAKPLSPLRAWQAAVDLNPRAADHWRRRLEVVDEDAAARCLARVPDERIDPERRAFACKILGFNRARLLDA